MSKFGAWSVGTAAFFAALLCCGLWIFPHYGISWDEQVQRNYGLQLWNYVLHQDPKLLSNSDRYHGSFVELLLIGVEKGLGLRSWRDIMLSRHLMNFLLFYAAVAAFYRICLIRTGDRTSALMGAALLTLSPRIFADAFYNSKDLGFLSLFVIAMYTLERYRSKPGVRRILFHAAAVSAAIATRMGGLLLVWITAAYLFIEFWSGNRRAALIRSAIFAGLVCGLTVLFWPTLWPDPINEFIAAYYEIFRYPRGPQGVFFEGQFLHHVQVPRDYLAAWIGMTVPPAFLALTVLGAGHALARLRDRSAPNGRLVRDLVHGAWAGIPLAHFWLNQPNVYDGWRHYYFVYPALVLWMVEGWGVLRGGVLRSRPIAVLAAALIFAEPAFFMVRSHPLQNVYFNFMAGEREGLIRRYDVDYWGLSYRNAFEHILSKDPRQVLRVQVRNTPGYLNRDFLKPEHSKRIRLVREPQAADYYLTNYRLMTGSARDRIEAPPGFVFEAMIKADGIPVLGVYRSEVAGAAGK